MIFYLDISLSICKVKLSSLSAWLLRLRSDDGCQIMPSSHTQYADCRFVFSILSQNNCFKIKKNPKIHRSSVILKIWCSKTTFLTFFQQEMMVFLTFCNEIAHHNSKCLRMLCNTTILCMKLCSLFGKKRWAV